MLPVNELSFREKKEVSFVKWPYSVGIVDDNEFVIKLNPMSLFFRFPSSVGNVPLR